MIPVASFSPLTGDLAKAILPVLKDIAQNVGVTNETHQRDYGQKSLRALVKAGVLRKKDVDTGFPSAASRPRHTTVDQAGTHYDPQTLLDWSGYEITEEFADLPTLPNDVAELIQFGHIPGSTRTPNYSRLPQKTDLGNSKGYLGSDLIKWLNCEILNAELAQNTLFIIALGKAIEFAYLSKDTTNLTGINYDQIRRRLNEAYNATYPSSLEPTPDPALAAEASDPIGI